MSEVPTLDEIDDVYPITVHVTVRRHILERSDWRDVVKEAAGRVIDALPEPHLT